MEQNKVQLIGYVGTSPVMKKLPDGSKRAGLRVATHHLIKKKDGTKDYQTIWHDVVAWDKTAEYAERSFVRGSHIIVEGSIVYRTYADQLGHTRYLTFIQAKNLVNLDR